MPPSLLDSQLATLERLAPDEPGLTITGEGDTDDVLTQVLAALTAERRVGLRGASVGPCPSV
jgi:gluconokinase